jgi:SAM-dependent methyltransferase
MNSLKLALKALIRKRAPVIFGDLARVEPVSRVFGLERGTPIDRYYIRAFIAANAGVIVGRAIEIGELRYLKEFGARANEKYILAPSKDIVKSDPEVRRTIIGDLTAPMSLPEGVADCFVCTQTINFVYDIRGAIRGAHRLLAPGGVFLGTVSGISQISRYDMDRWGDYWRFTTLSLERVLSEVFGSNVEVKSYGNALAAQALLQGIAVEDLPDRGPLNVHDDDYQLIIGFRATKDA